LLRPLWERYSAGTVRLAIVRGLWQGLEHEHDV
jgi:hypothetical protein